MNARAAALTLIVTAALALPGSAATTPPPVGTLVQLLEPGLPASLTTDSSKIAASQAISLRRIADWLTSQQPPPAPPPMTCSPTIQCGGATVPQPK